MNNKIKHLAEQAGLRFTQQLSNPMVPVVDGKETDFEKFAELIVRECAHIGFDAAYPYRGIEVKTAIRQHFGVNE